jgi:hypothetical protein
MGHVAPIEPTVSEHTPGPWTWYETPSGVCRIVPADGGLVIAECSVRDPGDPAQRANAALIASLPELLNLIQRLQQVNAELTDELSVWRAQQMNSQSLLNDALAELTRLRSLSPVLSANPQPPTPAIGRFLEGYEPKNPG